MIHCDKFSVWKPHISLSDRCWFVGYNPGIRSFETQCPYAHPINRFWRLLFDAGFTETLLIPSEVSRLNQYQLGLIDLVDRPTVSGNELTTSELLSGREKILKHVRQLHPVWLAANGLGIGRILTQQKLLKQYGDAGLLGDTTTRIWILPSSSGRAGSTGGVGLTYQDKLIEWRKLRDIL